MLGTRPVLGLCPNIPLKKAGIRIDPPVKVNPDLTLLVSTDMDATREEDANYGT